MLSVVLEGIGSLFAKTANNFTWFWCSDEPAECPKSLIK